MLDMTCFSTRDNKHFIRRIKCPPLGIIQHVINYQKIEGKQILRVRVDEARVLANSYEFNKLLLKNDTNMEITSGNSLNLNLIIVRLPPQNKDSYRDEEGSTH